MSDYYVGGYISTLSVLDELVCSLDCECIDDIHVYEEISEKKAKRRVPSITTVDTVMKHTSNPIDMIVNINLPAKRWKQIADIITCLTCVNKLETESYIVYNVTIQGGAQAGNPIVAVELLENIYKSYQGGLRLSVAKKKINKKGGINGIKL